MEAPDNQQPQHQAFADLPPLPADINQEELLRHLNAKFTSKNWVDNTEAVNLLRQINKSYPQSTNQVCEMFWNSILAALETPRTAVCKTALVFFQEAFTQVNCNLNDAIIQTTAPSIIHKTQHTNHVIRLEAQRAYEQLVSYCVKESLIVSICVSCADKNPKIAELAFKALEKVLSSVAQNITYLQKDTFKAIFTALKQALTGKRMDLKKHADGIVKGLYAVLGEANFGQLIQVLVGESVLEEKDVENIKQCFEPDTATKQPRLGEVLHRKRKLANAEVPEQFHGF